MNISQCLPRTLWLRLVKIVALCADVMHQGETRFFDALIDFKTGKHENVANFESCDFGIPDFIVSIAL